MHCRTVLASLQASLATSWVALALGMLASLSCAPALLHCCCGLGCSKTPRGLLVQPYAVAVAVAAAAAVEAAALCSVISGDIQASVRHR